MNEGEDYGNLPNQFPPFVQEVLDKFKVVMLSNLPKKLPLRHEVDYEIELESGAKPPALLHYYMAPPKLQEL